MDELSHYLSTSCLIKCVDELFCWRVVLIPTMVIELIGRVELTESKHTFFVGQTVNRRNRPRRFRTLVEIRLMPVLRLWAEPPLDLDDRYIDET